MSKSLPELVIKIIFNKNKCPVVHRTALAYISSYSIYEEPGFRNGFLIWKIRDFTIM